MMNNTNTARHQDYEQLLGMGYSPADAWAEISTYHYAEDDEEAADCQPFNCDDDLLNELSAAERAALDDMEMDMAAEEARAMDMMERGLSLC